MRTFLVVLTIFCLVVGSNILRAQATNAPAQPTPHERAALSFLPPDQQEQYWKAHTAALAGNPDLEAEGEQILQQGLAVSTPAEKQDFIEKMNSHRQKLRAAMLKADPTLGPVFAVIDKHISEMKAKQASQSPAGDGAASGH